MIFKKRFSILKLKYYATIPFLEYGKLDKFISKYRLYAETLHLEDSAILEVGVGFGHGLGEIVLFQELHQDSRPVIAFDSFLGFPKGLKADSHEFQKQGNKKYESFTLEFVLNYLKIIGVNDSEVNKIKFIKGFIPESLVEFPKVSIAFLNLDLDLYQPSLDALNFFWKYMSTGGIILLDDYDSNSVQLKWPGVKLAVDEFCELNQIDILRCIGNQAYLKR